LRRGYVGRGGGVHQSSGTNCRGPMLTGQWLESASSIRRSSDIHAYARRHAKGCAAERCAAPHSEMSQASRGHQIERLLAWTRAEPAGHEARIG
jgi:hypothetical protein